MEDIWWPVSVLLLITAAIAALAFALARRRDLGQGLVPERPGRRHGSGLLRSPLGLALRLTRTTAVVWAAAILLFAAIFAAVSGEMEDFMAGSDLFSSLSGTDGGAAFSRQYIAMMLVMTSVLSTVPVLGLMLRVRGEEKQGFTEHLLGRSVSRRAQFAGYFTIALVSSVLLQLLTALGFWAVASRVMDTAPGAGLFVRAALNYLPAMWVLLGLAALLAGWLPRWTNLVYGCLGLGFFVIYVGSMVELPDWTGKLSTFSLVARVPAEEPDIPVLAAMTGIAALLALLGFVGYRRRDVYTA